MNTSDLKLELFRKIDNLNDEEIKRCYNPILSLLKSSGQYALNSNEKEAIEEALEYSKKEKTLSHDEVIQEAKKKYPNLNIK